MLWMIGLSVLSCFVVLFLLGRRDERAIRRDWELLLTPKGESLYRNIEGRVHNELALVDLTYDEAFAVRELGSVDEAKRLLDVGYRVIEKFSPNMLNLLTAMANFSRMVSAMAPVTPLRPRDFKLTQIVSQSFKNTRAPRPRFGVMLLLSKIASEALRGMIWVCVIPTPPMAMASQ